MKKVSAFTLIELITAMAVILVLTSLVLGLASFANQKSNRIRAGAEIKMLETACEAFKTDHGCYPQGGTASGAAAGGGSPRPRGATDLLSPRQHFKPDQTEYAEAGEFLYKELSGDKKGVGDDPDGVPDKDEQVYVKEIDPRILKIDRDKTDKNKIIRVHYFQDPWGNPYGYSTAAAFDEQEFQSSIRRGQKDAARKSGEDSMGFNADSFDLWSTAGSNPSHQPGEQSQRDLEWAKWLKR